MVSLLSMILEGLKDIWNWTTTKPPTEISSPPPLDAPHPYGTAAQLNRFLIQYYTNLLGLSYDEASRLADELPIRGFILYGMPESVLEDIYGSLGRILYYELQHSLHGRVSIALPIYYSSCLTESCSIAQFGHILDPSDIVPRVLSLFLRFSSEPCSIYGITGCQCRAFLVHRLGISPLLAWRSMGFWQYFTFTFCTNL